MELPLWSVMAVITPISLLCYAWFDYSINMGALV